MDAKVKGKWLAALRSGKYRQGQSALAQRDSSKHVRYCCLGVLCEITPEAVRDASALSDLNYSYTYGSDSSDAYLPGSLRNDVNITPKQQYALARMNDDGVSFSEIADWIEERL